MDKAGLRCDMSLIQQYLMRTICLNNNTWPGRWWLHGVYHYPPQDHPKEGILEIGPAVDPLILAIGPLAFLT